MPFAVEPEVFTRRVEEAREAFDPEIHGRHDLPAMPKYPLDEWYDGGGPKLYLPEVVRVNGFIDEAALLYLNSTEELIRVLNPAERQPYLAAMRYTVGKDPKSNQLLCDLWDPEKVGSLFLWFSYSAKTCTEAALAVRSARFIDLFQLAYQRKFVAWGTGEVVFDEDWFWRMIKGDLEFSYGIHSIHQFETSFIRYLEYCAEKNLVYTQQSWGI